MSCQHENYNEYFENCAECGADEETVLFDSLLIKLDDMTAEAFIITGAYRGYATPEDLQRLSELKHQFAKNVAKVVIKCRTDELMEGVEV